MKTRGCSILAILVASLLAFEGTAIFPAYSATEIYVAPSVNAYETATTLVDFKFNVTVWVKDVADLYAYQVMMYYDPAMIKATRAWVPKWDHEWIFYEKTTVGLTPANGSNYVQLGDSILGAGNTFAGTGKLGIIEFRIIKAPSKMQELSCTLAINNIDTYLLNSELTEIFTLKTNGSYKYTWSHPPKPHLAVNPTLVRQPNVGAAFDIELYIMELDAAWQLTNATISLSFNTTIIDVNGGAANVTIPPNWAGPNEVNLIHEATDRVNITVRNPSAPSGNVLVATIKFTVMSHGITSLVFSYYHLYDHVTEIPADPPINGWVNTEKLISDVAVINVISSKTIVGQGFSAYIDVTVANQGDLPETFNVSVFSNDSFIQRKTISLSNGSTTTVSFTWNTIGFTKGNYTQSAVADTIPGEFDTADNAYTNGILAVAMIGDISGPLPNAPDGKVDIRDIATVAKAFGTYPVHPLWNPNADVTGSIIGLPDNKVDIKDIAIVAKEFGKIDP